MILLLTLACTAPRQYEGPNSQDDSGTGLPQDTAAAGDVSEPEVEETENESVFRVTWTTKVPPVAVWAEYGVDGAYDHRADATSSIDGTVHTVTLSGLGAGHTWSVRTVTEFANGSVVYGEAGDVVAPEPAMELPTLTAAYSGDAPDGFVVTATAATDQRGYGAVYVINRDGEYVWWRIVAIDEPIPDARLSLDGQWIEWIEQGATAGIHRERVDGSDSEFLPVANAHHTFVPLASGGWLVPVAETRDVDGMEVVGDTVVKVDRFGVTTPVWSAWDTMVMGADVLGDVANPLHEWTHLNSMHVDEAAGLLYLSLRELNAVIEVRLVDGGVNWQLGGDDSDFQLFSGQPFEHQHSARMEGDHLVVFDNGDFDAGDYARVVAYKVDETYGTYTQDWEYATSDHLQVPAMGNHELLTNGDRFVAFGVAGRMTQLDTTGRESWRVDAADSRPFGFSHVIPVFGGAQR